MNIKVLGPGCTNCKTLANRVHEAALQVNIDALIEKVEDVRAIASYGILRTPGLVINDEVVVYGRVPTVEEIKSLILNHASQVKE
jgi:small redox-active disulfide protein 2